MAVARMKKICITALKKDEDRVVEKLHDLGVVEIIFRGEGSDRRELGDYSEAKISRALEFLTPYFVEKKGFLEKLVSGKPRYGKDDVQKILQGFNYDIVDEVEEIAQRLNVLANLNQKLTDEKNILVPWQGLNASLDGLETKSSKIVLGSVERKKYNDFTKKLSEKFTNADARWISRNESIVNCLVIFSKKCKGILEFLTSFGFKEADLPESRLTSKERMDEIDGELWKNGNEIDELRGRAAELAQENLRNLQVVSDFLNSKIQRSEIQNHFSFSEKCFFIFAWIKKEDMSFLENELKKTVDAFQISEMPMDKEEIVPVAMENKGILKPFEFVTNIYGFPKYSEVDPTPFLAGFFIIFFGMCLTDAGYGLAIALSSWLALKFLKIQEEAKKLIRLMFYGGLATFVAGAFLGGWFGIVLEDLPTWLGRPLISLRLINPVENPLVVLVLSLILGYVHLLLGNAISLWWKIRNGEVKDGLFGPGVWMFFLLSVGFWIVSSQNIFLAGLAGISLYLVYLAIALIIFTQGKSDNFIMKIFGGFAELYFGVTGYISDILSYSRLLALGLATGIIGMVVNLIGSMLNEMIPYIGWILMILVLIGGHILNLVINLVGAFVHSGRLQYVEFFKTFFDGGGRPFKPFKREDRYINLN